MAHLCDQELWKRNLTSIDTMDASIQMMLGAIRQTQPGEYTERIFGLDNRSFYVPKINKKEWSIDHSLLCLLEDSVVLLEESVAFQSRLFWYRLF